MEQDAPVLIIGPPRSGTTLLATMLNAHPRLFVANETKVLINLLPGPGKPHRPLSKARAATMLRQLELNELMGAAPLPRYSDLFAQADEPTVPTFLQELFRHLARREGKSRWGEKTAVAYRNLEAIRCAFPNACFLGLERAPEEIAASYERIVPKWGSIGGMTHWIDFRRAVARQDSAFRIHLVSYPELVREPEDTLRRVCEFLDEEFCPQMLQFHRTRRAAELKQSPEFAGASMPLRQRANAPMAIPGGTRGRVMRWLIDVGNHAKTRATGPRPLERLLRIGLYCRAAAWEIRQPDFRQRIARKLTSGGIGGRV